MTRRQFRPLNLNTGSPTTESFYRRSPTRRTFKQLTGGGFIEPIPFFGRMYRMLRAESIADYEGLSTVNWTTGASGNISKPTAIADTSYNAIYHHQVIPDVHVGVPAFVMNPIRWTVAHPETPGGSDDFDWWGRAYASPRREAWWGRPNYYSGTSAVGTTAGGSPGLCLVNTMLIGGSHCIWADDLMRVSDMPMPVSAETYTSPAFATFFRHSGYQALASSTPVQAINYPVRMKYVRHRVNGVAVGTLLEDVAYPKATFNDPNWLVEIEPGDTWEVDIWYELEYPPVNPNSPGGPSKSCINIPLTRVSNSSESAQNGWLPVATFRNVNFSPYFNFQEETYNITINGHSGWTLKDGSDGPHKMVTEDGWTAQIVSNQIIWTNPSDNGYAKEFHLSWWHETAILRMVFGKAMRDLYLNNVANSRQSVWYTPTSDSTQVTSTTSSDYGTVAAWPNGIFDQAGSTTFDLVPWSISGPETVNEVNPWPPPGRISGGLTPAPLSEIPTSVTITKTTQ